MFLLKKSIPQLMQIEYKKTFAYGLASEDTSSLQTGLGISIPSKRRKKMAKNSKRLKICNGAEHFLHKNCEPPSGIEASIPQKKREKKVKWYQNRRKKSFLLHEIS